jgi:hypothetical protein
VIWAFLAKPGMKCLPYLHWYPKIQKVPFNSLDKSRLFGKLLEYTVNRISGRNGVGFEIFTWNLAKMVE